MGGGRVVARKKPKGGHRKKTRPQKKTSTQREYLVRGETHDIDAKGQGICANWLPRRWVANPLKRDYAKDYHIEITEQDTRKVTGDVIYIQLKSEEVGDYRFDNSVIACKVEKKHLGYWCDEARLPVFLLVVDVS